MGTILIREPDANLRGKMMSALNGMGHTCVTVFATEEVISMMRSGERFLAVIDAGTPWKDSSSLLESLAEHGVPVVFTRALRRNAEHLRRLYHAECEVLCGNLRMSQLASKVSSLLSLSDEILIRGGLQMNALTRDVTLNGQPLALTAQEFSLLRALMEEGDSPLSREHLLRKAWGYQSMGETRTVDVHVQRLRRKLGASSIETVYRLGYRLTIA